MIIGVLPGPEQRTLNPVWNLSSNTRQTFGVFRYFLGAYPTRSALMISLMIFAGLAEGVGVLTLVPVLELADQTGDSGAGIGKVVLDAVRSLHLEPTLSTLLTLIVICITIKAILLFLAQRQVGYTVAGVVRDLRLKLMRGLLEVRWSYFGMRTPGEFAASVTAEAVRAASAYMELCRIVAAFFQMAAYVLVATLVSWWIALGAASVGVIISIVARRFFRQSRDSGIQQTTAARDLSSRLVDILQGIKPIKAMGREGLVWPLLEHETETLNRAKRKEVSAQETVRAFQEPILTLFLAIGLFFVVGMAGEPLASTLLMAFIFYRLVVHINTLQMRYQLVLVGESAFFSLRDQMDAAQRERELSSGETVVGRMSSGIELDGLAFSYGDLPVLKGVDAFIPAGSFVAIHGESGSGKTTLADLIVGLHDPDAGRILVDGHPLDDLDIGSWRRSIGYVPQEMLLFSESIFLNVTLGDPEFTKEDAERALRLAGAWSFVQDKEGELDHLIGDRGAMLSGGQRQRIALARALVGSPSLLILDEVTTALDPATELAICQTLKELAGETTILSISHQRAMREAADLVFIMKDGRLGPITSVEVGASA